MDNPQKPTKPQQPLPPQQPRPFDWRLLLWIAMVMLISFWVFNQQRGGPVTTLAYSQFKQDIRQDKVASITVKGQQIHGQFKEQKPPQGKPAPPQAFQTVMPSINDPELMPLLEKHDVKIVAQTTELSWWLQLLVGMLPWLLLIGLIFYSSKKMQERMGGMNGPGGIFGFGKSRARRYRREETTETMADVAGLTNAKEELQEIIDYLRDPERFRELGAKIPRGVLLTGPPGTGKTMLARAVAGEANVSFFSITGSEFVEMFVGVGASRVRDMFTNAKAEAPSIIFIDEIDAIGRSRGSGLGGGHDEREQTLNQILAEMDGFSPHETVIVMAATNRPDVLDAALLRPGRFDRKVTLDLPNRKARVDVLKVHTRRIPLADDVDLDSIAAGTAGLSGADLANLVNEAALLTGRKRRHKVDKSAFEEARDKVLMGVRREALLTEDDKRRIAYHESGHALLGRLLPNADPVHKVTIIPRGQSLGATEQIPMEDRYNMSTGYLEDRICSALGGRVAEQLVFGELSTGAAQDLEQVTRLARHMVCQWGMSEKLGPVYYKQGEEHVFLGRELAQPRDHSDNTAELIDEEVRKLIRNMEARAQQLLKENRDKLDALAEALLEHETLDADAIDRVLAQTGAVAETGRRAVPHP
jgi:cell division protease FtsH